MEAWRRSVSGGREEERYERLAYAGRRGEVPERKARE
jgi:hypothetical protein